MKRPWYSVKGFLCWYWQGDISAARRLLLRGSRSCDYCPGIALSCSPLLSAEIDIANVSALSQEYLRLELAYLINFEQRRLFLGIRDKKDFVDKAVWTWCYTFPFYLLDYHEDADRKQLRAIMSSALLKHQGLQHKRTIFSWSTCSEQFKTSPSQVIVYSISANWHH